MDTVTDIFAFAAEHADYWTEFLSGTDYSEILSPDEIKALEAARLHLEDGIYSVLAACGATLAAKLKAQGFTAPTFYRGPTSRNRKVRVAPPAAWKDLLYRLEFEFSPDDENRHVLLYGSLVVKKRGPVDELAKRLAQKNVAFRVDGYYLYAPGVRIEKTPVTNLAEQVAGGLAALVLAAA